MTALQTPRPEPVRIEVWWRAKGWLCLRDPTTNQIWEVRAKGCPRWVFDRIRDHHQPRRRPQEVPS